MISHEHKCIFVHIPRTAGTSVEKYICGFDWFIHEKKTKHLLASQAKILYKDYWDEYFKFSFVRNPWDRMVSLSKYGYHYNVYIKDEQIDCSQYMQRFKFPQTIEFDYRYFKRKDIQHGCFIDNCVYGNILNEPDIDFVGKFENLAEDMAFVGDKLKINKLFNIKSEVHKGRKPYQYYYNPDSVKQVKQIYLEDIKKYQYAF